MKADTSAKGNDSPENIAIYEHLADYVIQTLIKEDVNAFIEATLLHQLLVYKLPAIAPKLMYRTIQAEVEGLKKGKDLNLMKEIGGINMQKRMHFRSEDQSNSFTMLFFDVVEQHPRLLEPVDGEEMFEKFMIYCIYVFRQKLEDFAIKMAKDHCELEHKHKLYIHRRGVTDIPEVPTYADYIADRIDDLVK